MNLAFPFFIFVLGAGADLIDLPVRIKATPSSCMADDLPNKPTLAWRDDNTAIVKATVFFGSGTLVSEESPQAHLEGTKLKVCYHTHAQKRDPNAPRPMCLFPEDLEFTIDKLPRGDYEPKVFRCDLPPKPVIYKCIEGDKTRYTIYETPGCAPVVQDED
jgi:hypothetical protein